MPKDRESCIARGMNLARVGTGLSLAGLLVVGIPQTFRYIEQLSCENVYEIAPQESFGIMGRMLLSTLPGALVASSSLPLFYRSRNYRE